ncbi:MAG: hypothetical protein ACRD5D_05050, partial [Candidatus Polarisedimenticolia bacterium]
AAEGEVAEVADDAAGSRRDGEASGSVPAVGSAEGWGSAADDATLLLLKVGEQAAPEIAAGASGRPPELQV